MVKVTELKVFFRVVFSTVTKIFVLLHQVADLYCNAFCNVGVKILPGSCVDFIDDFRQLLFVRFSDADFIGIGQFDYWIWGDLRGFNFISFFLDKAGCSQFTVQAESRPGVIEFYVADKIAYENVLFVKLNIFKACGSRQEFIQSDKSPECSKNFGAIA